MTRRLARMCGPGTTIQVNTAHVDLSSHKIAEVVGADSVNKAEQRPKGSTIMTALEYSIIITTRRGPVSGKTMCAAF